MSWDPALYLSFGGHRTRPAADLLARVPLEAPARVIDLGCGPGNSTGLLAARWPRARATGLDNSQAMLTGARAAGVKADWLLADLATWRPDESYDLIFANATLQWLGDQENLLPRLISYVAPGGVFAFQVPVNYNAPSHALMRETASDPRWKDKSGMDTTDYDWLASLIDYYGRGKALEFAGKLAKQQLNPRVGRLCWLSSQSPASFRWSWTLFPKKSCR